MRDPHLEPHPASDLDQLLEDSVSGLPPMDIVAQVTPWRRAMRRVLAGLGLSALTLQFWGLQYWLPTIGMLLMLLGFRTLRQENRWLGACWALTVLRALILFPMLLLETTLLPERFPKGMQALSVLHIFILFALFFCLRSAFLAVQRKAGLPPRAGGATALLIWYGLLGILAMLSYRGWILGLALIVSYVLILRSLYKLYHALDEAGYAIKPVRLRLSDRTLVIILCVGLLAGGALGFQCGGRYPMHWQPVSAVQDGQAQSIRAHLLSLGFPAAVLEDLTDAEISACAQAQQVVTETPREHIFPDDLTTVTPEQTPGQLRITHVAVALPDGHWQVFHHFFWLTDPAFYGTECLQLWPADRDSAGWIASDPPSGRVLFDRADGVQAAPFWFLGKQRYLSDGILWEPQQQDDLFAAFSFPREASRARGYVTYGVRAVNHAYLFSSWMNYTHQQQLWQYPVRSAMQVRMENGWNRAGAFATVQDALQFYPAEMDDAPAA